ncbi:hypothetical protein FN846DRAFT_752436, partial [Sphaerosporella brunnea]
FNMRAYITIVGADMIGRSKLMQTTGNRSYSYCEHCEARGIWNGSIYCPFTPPIDAPEKAKSREGSGYPWTTLDRVHLPLRSDTSFRATARHIARDLCNGCQKKYGIRGPTILQELQSLDFPRSFPPDLMHLMYENVIPAIFRSEKLAKFVETDDPWNIIPEDWMEIGKAFDKSATLYPLAFGEPMRNFTRHCHELKAAEWATVTKHATPIFLKTLLSEQDYQGVLHLVDAIILLEKSTIKRTEQEDIGRLLKSFSSYYEE